MTLLVEHSSMVNAWEGDDAPSLSSMVNFRDHNDAPGLSSMVRTWEGQ